MNVQFGRSLAADSVAKGIDTRVRHQPSRRALRVRLHLTMIAIDVVCLLACFRLASLLYHVGPRDQWLVTFAAIVPVYLLSAFGARAYSVDVLHDVARGISRSLRSLLIAASAVLFIAFYLKSSDELSRVIFAIGTLSSAVTLTLSRIWFVRRARSILGGNPYTVVLITEHPEDFSPGQYSVMIPASAFDPGAQVPEMYDRLADALQHADRVVVSCGPERRLAWTQMLQGANVQAEIVAPELAEIGPMSIARLGDKPTLVVAQGPLSLPDRVLKRAFDLVVAGFALLLLAPLLIATAIAIKLESPGPVLFVQTRIGRANKLFRVFKFRSMRSDLCDANASTLTARNDVRVTRVGKFIRASSIDELPQLVNVLRGEMSIVGPRPHALGATAGEQLYWEIDQRYWHRHAAKPGVTGLAQVRGYRGNTNHESDLVNRLHADLEYLNHWSIWRDIKIIFMTFRVLSHSNAY